LEPKAYENTSWYHDAVAELQSPFEEEDRQDKSVDLMRASAHGFDQLFHKLVREPRIRDESGEPDFCLVPTTPGITETTMKFRAPFTLATTIQGLQRL
jgi:hypothetical protein